jgi:hypothetical protein
MLEEGPTDQRSSLYPEDRRKLYIKDSWDYMLSKVIIYKIFRYGINNKFHPQKRDM